MKRILAFSLTLFLLCAALPALAASKPSPTPPPREIETEVIRDVPEEIRQVLDIAYRDWETVYGKAQKNPNKYTKWRNNGKFGWCGGFITWCMLEAGIPQAEWAKTEIGEVEGVRHVKEAGVGKLVTGYLRMYRTTMTPQKGFIMVYGKKGSSGLWHVGLVYDVEKLENGKYRLTTIEGNVGNSVRMFIQDYDPNVKKKDNLSAVPKEERDREETKGFSYKHNYGVKDLYVNMFLMPWVPDQYPELAAETAAAE